MWVNSLQKFRCRHQPRPGSGTAKRGEGASRMWQIHFLRDAFIQDGRILSKGTEYKMTEVAAASDSLVALGKGAAVTQCQEAFAS